MFRIKIGKYDVIVQAPGLPALFANYLEHAKFTEQIDLSHSEGTSAFLAIGYQHEWPFLVIAQHYMPGEDAGFHPGILIIPETDILFVGAGERLLAYDLGNPSRLWEDSAKSGFWAWERYHDIVLMSAELEFAAWDINANKLWTIFVEPPWSYTIYNHIVELDIMGEKSSFSLQQGP